LDQQAGYEKALGGVLVALAGADLIAAAGLVEDALASSAEQLVVDNEILGMIFRAVRGVEVDAETLGVEAVQEVGPGGSFLETEHTRAHLRKEYFMPKLVTQPAAEGEQARSVLDTANAAASKLIKTHAAPELPAEAVREIQQIVEAATRDLHAV
jgi:trimethylamine--corrinoid protein Co-methyltransferase